MKNHTQHELTPSDDLYKLGGLLLGAVFAIGLALWGGVQLASLLKTGMTLPSNPDDLAAVLWNTVAENRSDPAAAWPDTHRGQLPGALLSLIHISEPTRPY